MRMRTKTAGVVAVAAAMMLLAARSARATGPEPKYVPADAKWVVHADVERLAKTKTYDIVMRQAEKDDPKVREKLAQFGEALGTRIPEDLRGVTLVGRTFDEKSAVLIVRGKLDKDRLLGMAKAMPGFTSSMHGTVEIATWKEPEQPTSVSGAFLADDTLVLGWTPADVGRMLDLAAGREKPAPVDGLLAGAEQPVMAYLAGNGLAELQKLHPVSPLLSQVTSAQVSMDEKGDDLSLRAVLAVTSPEIANQVKGAMEGFRALIGLAALEDNDDDEAKAVAEIVKRATVTAEASTVKLDLPIPVSRLSELFEQDDATTKKPASGAATQKSED